MSKITIAQLETAETSIQELTVAELDATKGGYGYVITTVKNVGASDFGASDFGASNLLNGTLDNNNIGNHAGIANGDNQVNL